MSDRFEGFGEARALACVIRTAPDGPQLLVFEHPFAGVQIPKGSIEPGETARMAAARELDEESGLKMQPVREILRFDRAFSHPVTGDPVLEDWRCWLFEASPETPETWTHHADEEDMDFGYRWVAIDGGLTAVLHPHFWTVSNRIEQMFGSPEPPN